MSARSPEREPLASTLSTRRSYVYVLPCDGEDLLKLGFTRDPLQRLRTLHRRYFDFFDLDAGFLVQTDSVRDARAIERRWAARLIEHRAAMPLTIAAGAGGDTEWYRGALAALQLAATEAESAGYAVHCPLRRWLATNLRSAGTHAWEWARHALLLIDAGQTGASTQLRDGLDALAAAGLDVADCVDDDVLRVYRSLLPR
jgi:hypothetical protein